MKEQRTILALMDRVLREHFAGASWAAWRSLLKAIFALPMTEVDLTTYRALTGRTEAAGTPAREVWMACGRRSGKSMIAALVAVFLATCRQYRLAPGERGVVMLIAADRRQARVVRRYIGGLLNTSAVLKQLVSRETAESISLSNGIDLEIHSASFKTVRGYTVVGAVLDEIAFWPTDDAADPDREILAALRPAMATVPEALLLALSSPYARRGELWRAHRDHFGRDGDPVLVIQAETRALNPSVSQAVIDRAYADDAIAAAAEYGAQFRSDVEGFVSREALAACVVVGRRELPPVTGIRYTAFVDPAGGSGTDSFTLAIGHAEQKEHAIAVIDAVREVKPPFSPAETVEAFAALLRSYHITRVVGDRYGGEWAREVFRANGVAYDLADKPKSDLYRDALALLNSGRLELLDEPRVVAQLAGLERRTARGGRDSIDHAPGGHDDCANVVCGLAVKLVQRRLVRPTWGRDAVSPMAAPSNRAEEGAPWTHGGARTTLARRLALGDFLENNR